jgi:hypothetical protein
VKRIAVISLFLARNLFRSLLGLAPLAATLGTYAITFHYRGNPVDYFAAVGGFDLALVCLVTTLVVAAQANRAALYPLLARLPRRWELLAAVLMASLGITAAMGLLFTGLAVLQRTADLAPIDMLLILPRWLALFALAATLGLHFSRLAGRDSSRLLFSMLLILVLVASDQQIALQRGGFGWLLGGAGVLASPFIANMMVEVHGVAPGRYLLAVMLPLAAAGLLFLLAAWLFRRKDLLWTD